MGHKWGRCACLTCTRTHRVAEIRHGEELVQVILHGGPAQQHPPLARQRAQRLVGERGVILQAVRPALKRGARARKEQP